VPPIWCARGGVLLGIKVPRWAQLRMLVPCVGVRGDGARYGLPIVRTEPGSAPDHRTGRMKLPFSIYQMYQHVQAMFTGRWPRPDVPFEAVFVRRIPPKAGWRGSGGPPSAGRALPVPAQIVSARNASRVEIGSARYGTIYAADARNLARLTRVDVSAPSFGHGADQARSSLPFNRRWNRCRVIPPASTHRRNGWSVPGRVQSAAATN